MLSLLSGKVFAVSFAEESGRTPKTGCPQGRGTGTSWKPSVEPLVSRFRGCFKTSCMPRLNQPPSCRKRLHHVPKTRHDKRHAYFQPRECPLGGEHQFQLWVLQLDTR